MTLREFETLKVGDTVMIKVDAYRWTWFMSDMNRFLGKEVKIHRIISNNIFEIYDDKVDGTWWISRESAELVKQKPLWHIYYTYTNVYTGKPEYGEYTKRYKRKGNAERVAHKVYDNCTIAHDIQWIVTDSPINHFWEMDRYRDKHYNDFAGAIEGAFKKNIVAMGIDLAEDKK